MIFDNFGIIIHGGAGSLPSLEEREIESRRGFMRKAILRGYAVLKNGGSSLDAVEASLVVMEDSSVFNAGSGSCLTIEGRIECDAGVMTGDLNCGAVANSALFKNPISLARAVMEKSDHVLISGDDSLRKFASAVSFKMAPLFPTRDRKKQYFDLLKSRRASRPPEWKKNMRLSKFYAKELTFGFADTIGAVAIDSKGRVSSGVSTGGRFLKLPGRIGDSAIPGSGLYADSRSGAACATGAGEEIIRMGLCKTVCDLMRVGLDPQRACDSAINIITERRGAGTAGVIAVDTIGRFGISRNTEMMPYAIKSSSFKQVRAIVLPKEDIAESTFSTKESRRFSA